MLLSGVISAKGFFSAFLPYIVALGPFRALGGFVGCVQSQRRGACALPRLRLIILVSFRQTLIATLHFTCGFDFR